MKKVANVNAGVFVSMGYKKGRGGGRRLTKDEELVVPSCSIVTARPTRLLLFLLDSPEELGA